MAGKMKRFEIVSPYTECTYKCGTTVRKTYRKPLEMRTTMTNAEIAKAIKAGLPEYVVEYERSNKAYGDLLFVGTSECPRAIALLFAGFRTSMRESVFMPDVLRVVRKCTENGLKHYRRAELLRKED